MGPMEPIGVFTFVSIAAIGAWISVRVVRAVRVIRAIWLAGDDYSPRGK